jgi:hypothetical protein
MSDNNTPPDRPSLGNTLFISGLCIVMGAVAFLIGIGVIPSGNASPSASAKLLSIGAGLLFIFAGFTIITRDFAGARNGEEIPANAPFFLRLTSSLLNIVLIAIFAGVTSVIAFGPFFAGGFGAVIFRIINGVFAIILWYAVIYLIYDKIRKRGA